MPATSSTIDSDAGLQTSGTAGIIGYRLRRAQLSVFQRFLAVFDELNLRPAEYSVLVLIADNPGRKQTAIAEALGIKRANFVTLAHGLEDRGLIDRRQAADDKRANALHLSESGVAFVAGARALHDAMERELIDRLGGREARDTLLGLLDKVM